MKSRYGLWRVTSDAPFPFPANSYCSLPGTRGWAVIELREEVEIAEMQYEGMIPLDELEAWLDAKSPLREGPADE